MRHFATSKHIRNEKGFSSLFLPSFRRQVISLAPAHTGGGCLKSKSAGEIVGNWFPTSKEGHFKIKIFKPGLSIPEDVLTARFAA